jgi:GT2 family glycosyltransferase
MDRGHRKLGPKGRAETANSVSELVDQQATRLKEPSVASHSATDTPIVTWIGQAPTPSNYSAAEQTSIRLHFFIVDRLVGIGYVVAGWFSDPLSAVATAYVDGAIEQLDLLSDAILLTERHQLQGFDTPRGIPIKFGFVSLVPEPPLETKVGLHVRLNLVAGGGFEHAIPLVGDMSRLVDILAAAPVDYPLRIVERILSSWRVKAGGSQRLPERLEALAGQIHRRIGRGRDRSWPLGVRRTDSHVDVAIRVGTQGMLIAGRLVHDYAEVTKEVVLVSLFGRRVVLDTPLPTRASVPRKSGGSARESETRRFAVGDSGFATFAAIEGLDPFDVHWILEVTVAGGTIRRVPFVCPPELPPLQGIEAAVALAEEENANFSDLFERAISPAVEWFWSQTRGAGLASTETVYGSPPSDALVSIIVPVYGRLDFVRHQIARFSNDPEFRADTGTVELIYVLDDPAKAEAFNRLCRFLHDVYSVPFRTLVQGKNRGYSAANNAGAAIATGSLLLLLNSDVFPEKPHWVGRLAKTYDTLDNCGALGCRLLFEDGSIQHAGMSFRESRMMAGCWENYHPARGLSVPFDIHANAEPVPAVTGACLMIERALFNQVGCMSEDYVIADFEDSDLCVRVQEQGFKVYYTPEVELYHLERQSMQLIGHGDVWWRQSLALYNMWKHSRRWSSVIPRILESFVPALSFERLDDRPSIGDEGVDEALSVVSGTDGTAAPGRRSKNGRSAGVGKRSGRGMG